MKKIIPFFMLFIATAISAVAQDISIRKEFNTTLASYFDVKNALAKDNASEASQSSNALLKNLDRFPVRALSEQQQIIWKTELAIIKKASLEISTEKAIKVQRQSFWPLSSSMVKLVKALKMNVEVVYVQYCPMAKKSWLNEIEAVQNPFYGSMMYDCGEVAEVITKAGPVARK